MSSPNATEENERSGGEGGPQSNPSSTSPSDTNNISQAKKGGSRSRTTSTSSVQSAHGSLTGINRRISVNIPEVKEDSPSFFRMSREKKFTVGTFCFANFCVGSFYSLLAPFFPQEAALKGVTSTETGLIFGCFELVLIAFSPVFGTYLTKIGAKFLYCTGVMVCGTTTILFGFLDMCPPGATYVAMCFVVRFFEGIAAAAFSTASFAIMANTFPNNVAAMFGSLELFTGLGLMVGPPLGGALYQLGGFRLPFIMMGSVLVAIGILSVFLLPPQDEMQETKRPSIFSMLRLPSVLIMGYLMIMGSGSIGFLDVSLAIFLNSKYQLTPVLLGLVFLVGPGVYAFTAPLWGWIADKKPGYCYAMLMFGYLVGGLAFFFMGPAPFMKLPNDLLWLLIVCQGFMGLGIGTIVIAFAVLTKAAKDAGHEESLATFGLIAGIFNMFFSLGAFIGPLGGGALVDSLGFEWSAFIVGCFGLSGACLLFLYVVCKEACCWNLPNTQPYVSQRNTPERSPPTTPERQPLLRADNTPNSVQPVQA